MMELDAAVQRVLESPDDAHLDKAAFKRACDTLRRATFPLTPAGYSSLGALLQLTGELQRARKQPPHLQEQPHPSSSMAAPLAASGDPAADVASITAELLGRLHTQPLLSGRSRPSLTKSVGQLLDLVEAHGHGGQACEAQQALLQALAATVDVATARGLMLAPEDCGSAVVELLSVRSNTVRTAGVHVLRALLAQPEEAAAAVAALLNVWVAAQAHSLKRTGSSSEEAPVAFAAGVLLHQVASGLWRDAQDKKQQPQQLQQLLQLPVRLLRDVLPLLRPGEGPQDAAALVLRLAAQLLARLLGQCFPRTAKEAKVMGVLEAAACYLERRGSDDSARQAAASARSARRGLSSRLVLDEAREWCKVARRALPPGQVSGLPS
jgi:hypothetical protein